jgi:3-hydroxy acid dehydrogenase / malonic semialdehyde reductase
MTPIPTAFITGASSGFGLACAERFAAGGWNLILLARRHEKLKSIKAALEELHKIKVSILTVDVRQQKCIDAISKFLKECKCTPDLLVNNAGLAVGLELIQHGVLDDWERMIDTNIKGILYVSKAVMPFMIAAGKGHIVNIGSVAGKEAYPGGNVYSATKFAVDGLTKSMRIDLLPHGIKVTQIAPGAADTEFSLVRFKGDFEKAKGVYKGFKPLSGADVAEAIWFAANLPAHVNVNDMLLMPTAQAGAVHFHRE